MNSPREIERNARAYCELIGADPDELVRGVDVPLGIREPITVPRWCWYKDANVDQDRPLSGFEKAMMAQRVQRDAALARAQVQSTPAKEPEFAILNSEVVPGVYIQRGVSMAWLKAMQAQAG